MSEAHFPETLRRVFVINGQFQIFQTISKSRDMYSLCSAQDLLHPVRFDQAVPASEHGQEDLHIWPQHRPVEKCSAGGD
jgi:hypothetical protein